MMFLKHQINFICFSVQFNFCYSYIIMMLSKCFLGDGLMDKWHPSQHRDCLFETHMNHDRHLFFNDYSNVTSTDRSQEERMI